MQAGNRLRVRTVSTVQFIAGAAQNVGIVANFTPESVLGAGGGISAGKHCRGVVRSIKIIATQNLAYEIEFWGSATNIGGAVLDPGGANPANGPGGEQFLGKWAFVAADGTQASGDTFFHYFISGLDIAYQDYDMLGQFHMRLINRSAAAKQAAVPGALVVEFDIELTQGI